MTRTRKVWTGAAVLGTLALATAGFVWSGVYDVGADTPHTRPVYALLDTVRERSVQSRASRLTPPPDLASEERIRQGAGNYAAMCVGCHLAPGMEASELSRGLYPAPPNFSRDTVDAAAAFWTIKHGIKASGMPAWGHSMPDEYIWNLAAFVQAMPKLDAAKYQALVASSDGHSHGGGESMPHEHGESGHGDAHSQATPQPAANAHRHADGSHHVHADKKASDKPAGDTPAPSPTPQPWDDSHEHAH